MLHKQADDSVVDSKGRVLYFSLQRFISDIAQGHNCFICGARPDTAPFNDEHVLPDWILRRYKLHDRIIKLPNKTGFRYAELKIPCCTTCNSMMGDKFEKPISESFAKGPQALSKELKDDGPWRLFCWMSLIFVKTHLKDKYLNFYRNHRKDEMKIGDLHTWEELHHVHCVARAFYTGCQLAPPVIGSLLVLPAKVRPHFESFDYGDLSFAQTMLLRLDETAIIAVFNDSQAALSVYLDEHGEQLKKIDGPLSPLQLREIAVRLASINIHLADRPRFFSEIDLLSEEYKIGGQRPDEIRLETWKDEIQGTIMHHICADMIVNTPDREQILENLKTGRYTFLVDDNGNFARDHMELAPAPTPSVDGR